MSEIKDYFIAVGRELDENFQEPADIDKEKKEKELLEIMRTLMFDLFDEKVEAYLAAEHIAHKLGLIRIQSKAN